MGFQPGANLYTQGFGSRPENVEVPHIDTRAPATSDVNYPVGKVWINTSGNTAYILTSLTSFNGSVTANWEATGGGSSAIATINTNAPVGGNYTLAGTANQIAVAQSAGTTTFSVPSSPSFAGTVTSGTGFTATTGNITATTGAVSANTTVTAGTGITATTGNIAATAGAVSAGTTVTAGTDVTATAGNITATTGSVSAGTTVTGGTGVTATTGAITATNGNIVLGTAGNKINIATGANASAGTSAAMTAGAVTVATTAVTASSLIFAIPATLGTVTDPQAVYVSAITPNTSFTLTSADATDTSTWNWFLIN